MSMYYRPPGQELDIRWRFEPGEPLACHSSRTGNDPEYGTLVETIEADKKALTQKAIIFFVLAAAFIWFFLIRVPHTTIFYYIAPFLPLITLGGYGASLLAQCAGRVELYQYGMVIRGAFSSRRCHYKNIKTEQVEYQEIDGGSRSFIRSIFFPQTWIVRAWVLPVRKDDKPIILRQDQLLCLGEKINYWKDHLIPEAEESDEEDGQ